MGVLSILVVMWNNVLTLMWMSLYLHYIVYAQYFMLYVLVVWMQKVNGYSNMFLRWNTRSTEGKWMRQVGVYSVQTELQRPWVSDVGQSYNSMFKALLCESYLCITKNIYEM